MGIDVFAGVTAMETRTGAVTVRVEDPVTPLVAAAMIDVPLARLVAKPAALMVATAGAEEVQVAVLVRFCVVPLL
jgi:hypothetical protein